MFLDSIQVADVSNVGLDLGFEVRSEPGNGQAIFRASWL